MTLHKRNPKLVLLCYFFVSYQMLAPQNSAPLYVQGVTKNLPSVGLAVTRLITMERKKTTTTNRQTIKTCVRVHGVTFLTSVFAFVQLN